MRNLIGIDDKIGFLNPKNGRYIWTIITSMKYKLNGSPQLTFTLKGILDKENIFEMPYEEIYKFSKQPSEDFKDGRKLVRIKY